MYSIDVFNYLATLLFLLIILVVIFFFLPYTQNKQITFWKNLSFSIISTLLIVVVIIFLSLFLISLFGIIYSITTNNNCVSKDFIMYLLFTIITVLAFTIMLYVFCIYVTNYLNSLP